MIGKNFLLKLQETPQGILLPVRVSPGGMEFAVTGADEWKGSLLVRLREKAERGKANRELLEKTRRLFNCEVELVRGGKSREKKLLLKTTKKQLIERLSESGDICP